MPAPAHPDRGPQQPAAAADDPDPTDPPARPSSLDRLLHLTRALVGADADDDHHAPDDVQVRPLGDGHLFATAAPPTDRAQGEGSTDDRSAVDLLLRPLEGHPVEVLTGFVAPAAWSALGVLVPGRSFHLPDADESVGQPLGDRERVAIAYVVARDGASASACRRPDGTVWTHAAASLADAAFGRVDDVLRRALDLPTHPPEIPPVELWARLWLDRVLADVAARPTKPWSWPTIALLHPAAQLVLDDLSGCAPEVAESMPRLAEMLGHGRSWTDLRLDHASADWETPAIPADVAEWMDNGIFSRWLLDAVPPCGDTLVHLRDLLPQRLITRIERTLHGWGVSTVAVVPTRPPADERP
jgi:hypothetical protein